MVLNEFVSYKIKYELPLYIGLLTTVVLFFLYLVFNLVFRPIKIP